MEQGFITFLFGFIKFTKGDVMVQFFQGFLAVLYIIGDIHMSSQGGFKEVFGSQSMVGSSDADKQVRKLAVEIFFDEPPEGQRSHRLIVLRNLEIGFGFIPGFEDALCGEHS